MKLKIITGWLLRFYRWYTYVWWCQEPLLKQSSFSFRCQGSGWCLGDLYAFNETYQDEIFKIVKIRCFKDVDCSLKEGKEDIREENEKENQEDIEKKMKKKTKKIFENGLKKYMSKKIRGSTIWIWWFHILLKSAAPNTHPMLRGVSSSHPNQSCKCQVICLQCHSEYREYLQISTFKSLSSWGWYLSSYYGW